MFDTIKDPSAFTKVVVDAETVIAALEAPDREPVTQEDVPVVTDLDLEPATIVAALDPEPEAPETEAPLEPTEDPFTSEEGEQEPAATGTLSEPGDVIYPIYDAWM